MLTILSLIVNMIGPTWPRNDHKNPHSDSEQNIHMSFKYYEANVYKHKLDLLNILH